MRSAGWPGNVASVPFVSSVPWDGWDGWDRWERPRGRSGDHAVDDVAGADRQRAVDGVAHFGLGVDAEQVEHRRAEVFGPRRVAGGVGADLVGGAVDVAALDAAAGQQRGVALRAVVAGGDGVGR